MHVEELMFSCKFLCPGWDLLLWVSSGNRKALNRLRLSCPFRRHWLPLLALRPLTCMRAVGLRLLAHQCCHRGCSLGPGDEPTLVTTVAGLSAMRADSPAGDAARGRAPSGVHTSANPSNVSCCCPRSPSSTP